MVLAASRRVRYSDNEFCQSLQPPLVLKPILTFPKGRNKLPCFVNDLFSQSFQPPLVLKPILTFPKGRNKLPCFVNDLFSQSFQPPLVLKPILTFPKGRNKLPCFVKDLFSQSFQPPLVLPRRGDAGYSCLRQPITVRLPRVSVPPLRGRIGGG